jgi:hypothetical protein
MTTLKWCPDATTLSANERFDLCASPSAPTWDRDRLLEEFVSRHQRNSFYTFHVRHIADGHVVFRGTREIFKIGQAADPKKTIVEVIHPEIHLPVNHSLLQRSEPVHHMIFTSSEFPLEDMKQFMRFVIRGRYNATEDDLRFL